jgi:hypothetical protein
MYTNFDYFLWFLLALGVCTYVYTAFKNKEEVKVHFFGSDKNISVKYLIIICLLDGLVLGALMGYLLFRFI